MIAGGRVGSWFVAQPAPAVDRGRAHAVPRPGRSAGLLAVGGGAGPLGAALALGLARDTGAPLAVVLDWGGPRARAGMPGALAARRAARSLAERDLAASARGRLVWVALAEDEQEAAVQADQACAVAPAGAPVVLALSRPRTAPMDALLAHLDMVIVAGPAGDPRAAVAAHGLAFVARRVVVWSGLPSSARRRLAHGGLAVVAGRHLAQEAR